MTSLTVLGLGLMGHAMVRRLLTSGFTVRVWNRTQEKAEALRSAGAIVTDDIADAVSPSDLVVSMLSTSEVLADVAAMVRKHIPKNGVHVDMSTVSPATTRVCEGQARSSGSWFVHAPVLGSVPQVEAGQLLIFAGGAEHARTQAGSVFSALGKRTYHFDTAPDASHMKLCCNFFIASLIMTLGQGLRFAAAAGIDGHVLLDALGSSALGAPMFATKGKNILTGNFEPRFFLEHMLKDVTLFSEAAAALHEELPFVPTIQGAFRRAAADGLGSEDYSAVVKTL